MKCHYPRKIIWGFLGVDNDASDFGAINVHIYWLKLRPMHRQNKSNVAHSPQGRKSINKL